MKLQISNRIQFRFSLLRFFVERILVFHKKLENELKKTTKPKDDGVWVVQIYEEQSVEKKKFETETSAIAWAANFAREVNTKAGSDFNNLTFFDLMQRYLDEVSSKTVSHKKNVVMIRFLEREIIKSTNQKNIPSLV